MTEVSLLEENFKPFLIAVGWLVGYRFDDSDWEAISHGVRESDAELGKWYEYEFSGTDRVAFSLALDDAGGSIVLFRVTLPESYLPQVRLLAEFCRHFRWTGGT